VKILIVDDHALFRDGLVSLLNSQVGYSVVGEVGTCAAAIQKAYDEKPDLILMDISLPDRSGMEAVKEILTMNPDIKIVMLTVHESDEYLLKAISYGAKGYLLKNTPINNLLASIKGMERGELALSRSMSSKIITEFSHTNSEFDAINEQVKLLTEREREIFLLLGKDVSNQEIADRLTISVSTVKVHIHNILKKLSLTNRRETGQLARNYTTDLLTNG